ncbi:MAG: hypothetical protein CMJ87_11605 [Planctomycetes bacterium]|nr:hypothetical protein [Planctomycetota bacterium]
MATIWRIGGRTGVCIRCEREFDEGERHVSSLVVEADAFRREDHCVSCWGTVAASASPELAGQELAGAEGALAEGALDEGAPEGAFFWWFTRRRAGKKQGLQLDLSSLEHLFLQLEGRGEVQVRELRYLLCLLLMRKRRLKVVKVKRTAEGEFFLVRRPRRKESLVVQVYDFSAERMAELRGQLQVVFEGLDPEGGVLPKGEGEESDVPFWADSDGGAAADGGAESGDEDNARDRPADSDEADDNVMVGEEPTAGEQAVEMERD